MSSVAASRLCGIGDEAGASLDAQLCAIRELGWTMLELRTIDGVAIAEMEDAAFASAALRVRDASLTVPVICSRIGSWAASADRSLREDEAELDALLSRAPALGARYVRVMSYPSLASRPDGCAQVSERLLRLCARAADRGLTLLHENCVGWAGDGHPERVLDLVATVEKRAPLGVLFDMGNGLAYGYDALSFLRQVLPYVRHVHVKDGLGAGETVQWVLPGEGNANVVGCLRLLVEQQYQGLFSIEPHLKTIPHLGIHASGASALEAFVAHGRRLEPLLASVLKGAV